MLSNTVVENATSPPVAVAVGGTSIAAGLVGSLPVIINVLVVTYFSLMILHKAYQMWKEWKADKNASRE